MPLSGGATWYPRIQGAHVAGWHVPCDEFAVTVVVLDVGAAHLVPRVRVVRGVCEREARAARVLPLSSPHWLSDI